MHLDNWLVFKDGDWRLQGPLPFALFASSSPKVPPPLLDGTYYVGIHHEDAAHLDSLRFSVNDLNLTPILQSLKPQLAAIDQRTGRGAMIRIVAKRKFRFGFPPISMEINASAEELFADA